MSDGLDGSTLRRAMTLFADALDAHRDEIDSLNVFPVADGDTGTNLLLTQRAVVAALPPSGSLADVASAMAEAALGSARGNSGVILSQVYEGFARGVASPRRSGSGTLAAALREASLAADRTMSDPKEGTILTVLRAAAETAEAHPADSDPAGVSRAVLVTARRALEDTREGLPELRAAGVVDAGGMGMVLLLDALQAALTNGLLSMPVGPFGPVGGGDVARDELPVNFELELWFGAPEAGPVREALAAMGSSVAVGGGPGRWLVHMHTSEPVAAAAAAADRGPTEVMSVAPLHAGGERVVPSGLVALAEAEGVAELLRSLGAVVVPYRSGGDLPSAPVDAAVGAIAADDVVVLMPGGATTVRDRPSPTRATESGRGARLHVMVIEGPIATVAAAAAFDPASSVAENVERMRSGASAVRELALGGATQHELELLETLCGRSSPEAITIVVGEGAPAADRQRVEEFLRERFPDAELEVWEGGRGCPPFLVGME